MPAPISEGVRRELADIDAALARIQAGSYGRCLNCGGPMGLQRLRAIPEARYCLACSGHVNSRLTAARAPRRDVREIAARSAVEGCPARASAPGAPGGGLLFDAPVVADTRTARADARLPSATRST